MEDATREKASDRTAAPASSEVNTISPNLQQAPQEAPILVGKAGTNLQVLAIDEVKELAEEMEHFTVSLGVTCPFCHVIGGDAYGFDRDDKEQKQTAREMIRMRQRINAQMEKSFGPKPVTCYTCHHGGKHPLKAPPDNGKKR